MSRKRNSSFGFVIFFGVIWMSWLVGCATTSKPREPGCGRDIIWDITPEAKVTRFDCQVGKHAGKPSLVFTVKIRNISEKPNRYRLNVFLMDMGKAAGYLIPLKGKPPAIGPGRAATVRVPLINTVDLPKKVVVVVKTIRY